MTENKDLRALMSKYIKVGEVRLKKWVQEPQERGDTSEKVYGMLNKVLHTSEATHIYDSRKYERLQIKLHNLEERVLNISKAFDMTDYQAITCHLKCLLSLLQGDSLVQIDSLDGGLNISKGYDATDHQENTIFKSSHH